MKLLKERKRSLCSSCRTAFMAMALWACHIPAVADDAVSRQGEDAFVLAGKAEISGNFGGGDFAPYYLASNNHGVVTSPNGFYARASIARHLNMVKRFSYAFCADLIAGYAESTDYQRYVDGSMVSVPRRPASFWIQQLYGELKYRGVFLTVGLKEHESALLNSRLSSGDFVESGNSRPIPEVRAGFIDFQDIPFTNGWVQIQGEIAYGKFTDNSWLRKHYNYLNGHLTQGSFYNYKRAYFRTKPSQPLSVTVGMQVGAQFGGTTSWYADGKKIRTRTMPRGFKEFIKMIVPLENGLDYYAGSSLGCWDLVFRYRLPNQWQVRAYMQKPWEDGSGIGFLNGFDGLWGIELATGKGNLITGAVIEYLDFTNQSGAMHWDPDDHPGTDISNRAEGADDYYNNAEYNPYAYYGMSIGTPFLRSPLYNLDGCQMFLFNRTRGFHIGIEGELADNLSYRLLGGYRKSWGSGYLPVVKPVTDTSFLAEVSYTLASDPRWRCKAQFGLDHGSLYGNNCGGSLAVSFSGNLSFSKK